MKIFDSMESYGHEQIVFARDPSVGLKAIIAVHSTRLGPALGGTRMFDYASEDEALYDVLRLSRGMTYKNAAAGLRLGGGKAVIMGDPKKLKSREFFHSYARFIDSLGGRYYTAEDVNINAGDVAHINEATKYVSGMPHTSGNPSPFTARGIYLAIKAGAGVKFGGESLNGKTIAVMGLGSVGYALCGHLHAEGARLLVYDINPEAVGRAVNDYGATQVSAGEILTSPCDIFSPCAMGAVLNVDNVKELKCAIVAGAANNVLVDIETGDALDRRDILYLPDYIINAGGVLNCGMEIVEGRYDKAAVDAGVDKIHETTLNIIKMAKDKGISTARAADEYAADIVSKG